MKKNMMRTVLFVLILLMILIVGLNFMLQVRIIHRKVHDTSEQFFWQIEQIIEQNEKTLEEIQSDFSETCLRQARIAATAIQVAPELAESEEELRKLADLIGVDELHLFTPEGEIYMGTHPQYYHLWFYSGEQMQFFLPMLKDRSLELCQEITPNTAEQKLMQYAAVWCEDGSKIVQIGVEPEQVKKVMEGRTWISVFSMMPMQKESNLMAVDPQSGEVLACTDPLMIGEDITEHGFSLDAIGEEISFSHMKINGTRYCVYMTKTDSAVLIRTFQTAVVLREVLTSTVFVMAYVLVIGIIFLLVAAWFVDRKIAKSIGQINQDLTEIKNGKKEVLTATYEISELTELCGYINEMLLTVRNFSDKISAALDKTQLPVGICEYSHRHQQGFLTSRVKEILLMEEDCRPETVAKRIAQLKEEQPTPQNNTYQLRKGEIIRYVRIEEYDYEKGRLAVLFDVTEEWQEKLRIRSQRDRDALTGLYNRWGFEERLAQLFLQNSEKIGFAAAAAIDADGLKMVNDLYGHSYGDNYLCSIAEAISVVPNVEVLAARTGGDEFNVIYYGCESQEALERVVAEVQAREAANYLQTPSGEKLPVRFSMGYACYPLEEENPQTLLRWADERMYANKRRKKAEREELR